MAAGIFVRMIHRHEIRVRYGETDQMGVVHHSVYPLYFEEARTELMRAMGTSYAELEGRGFMLPLVDLGIRFRRGPAYDDVLRLEARIESFNGVRLRLGYRMFRKADGEFLAEGHTEHAVVDRGFRPRRMPGDVAELFHRAMEEEGA